MKIYIHHKSPIPDSYRAARVSSLFNVEGAADFTLSGEAPINERDWQIGLIVGPSGTGKSSVARKMFRRNRVRVNGRWPASTPIIEAIAPEGDFDGVTAALSAVGLGSVPSWMRAYNHLSTGEKFRADLARILCERPKLAVLDEFTSTIDRRVATIAASAFAKSWRRGPGQFVGATCHYDVIDWLQPDWIFDTRNAEFSWRRLRRAPAISVDIFQTNWRYWPHFEPHHYLKLPHMIAATCYVGFVGDDPVVHLGVSTRPGMKEARACRLVVMPEWQGAGIGMRFLNEVCALWRRGVNRYDKPMPTLFHTSHPGLAAGLRRDPKWAQISATLFGGRKGPSLASLKRSMGDKAGGGFGGHFRAVQGFRYVEDRADG
ncbi:MAG: ABC transporter ATP-binding protein [Alphaproteobacteria bacterium]|nr:ABC transporter ATP-binding protein [Alphaproteobacteria bacterium]